MMANRNWITPLRQLCGIFLAGLLFLQSTMAFGAASVVSGSEGFQIVICGPYGVQTVTIDSDGNLISEAGEEGAPSSTGHCPFCVVGPALDIATPAMALRSAVFHAVPFDAHHDIPALQERRAFGHGIRAPPASL
jgi:hypothetical protein